MKNSYASQGLETKALGTLNPLVITSEISGYFFFKFMVILIHVYCVCLCVWHECAGAQKGQKK